MSKYFPHAQYSIELDRELRCDRKQNYIHVTMSHISRVVDDLYQARSDPCIVVHN